MPPFEAPDTTAPAYERRVIFRVLARSAAALAEAGQGHRGNSFDQELEDRAQLLTFLDSQVR